MQTSIACCLEQTLVLDDRTGDEICTACGRASAYLFSPPQTSKWGGELCAIRREIMDVCANKHVPDSIARTAIGLLNKVNTGISRPKAAYCLYQAFYLHDVPRSYKEISEMYCLPVKAIAKYEENAENTLKPSHLASRTLASLGTRISVYKIDQVKTVADSFYLHELSSASPQACLAVAIRLLLPTVDELTVSKHCHISKHTLAKHLRTIKG